MTTTENEPTTAVGEERSELLDAMAVTYLVIVGISVLQWAGGHRGRRAARERERAELGLLRAQTRQAHAQAATEDMMQYLASQPCREMER